ncbi:MAG TPA: alpha/beta hydrolase [Burkholderiales bacterium]|nr:alpha/beta hydrolase [Burkholderiales bacterium]
MLPVKQRWVVALAMLICMAAPHANAASTKEAYFTTSDGVRLHYIEAGAGKPLVLIPGWSQTAAQFKAQLDGLSDNYRVIAIDMRGHGESDKPTYGYRIHRLSKDVHEFLTANGLTGVTLAGHSMGCSVIWGYWELFGHDRVAKLVLIDQMPMITANPIWSEQEKTDAGAILDKDSLYSVTNALAGPDGVKTTEGFIGGMFTKQYPPEQVAWVIQQNLKFPRPYAARLLYDHATNDWRDVLPRIDVPTLIVGGKTSLVGWKSQVWMGTQIPNSKVEIFEEAEGGNHFMFMENPEKFNRLVRQFMN